MNIYTRDDIDARFTEIVEGYMNLGMRINCRTMRGSQGEIAKVDLTDGHIVIRVRIESQTDFRRDCEDVFIKTENYGVPARDDLVWNDSGETVGEEHFLSLTDCYGSPEAKFATLKEYDEAGIQVKREARCGSMYEPYESWRTLEKYDEKVVLGIVRKQKGLSTCKKENIKKVMNVPADGGRAYKIMLTDRKLDTVRVDRAAVKAF